MSNELRANICLLPDIRESARENASRISRFGQSNQLQLSYWVNCLRVGCLRVEMRDAFSQADSRISGSRHILVIIVLDHGDNETVL
jgi:hypothetical protein